MVNRAAAVAEARKAFERRYREWAVAEAGASGEVGASGEMGASGEPAVGADGGGDPAAGDPAASSFELTLRPPTEADALADPDGVAAWVREWRTHGAGVQWERRRWASAGTQDLPARLRLGDPIAVARFTGQVPRWRTAVDRAAALLALAGGGSARAVPGPARDAVRRALGSVVGLEEGDFGRLLGVLAFLGENPDSGLYVRQLPIRGVDTKWIGSHRGLVTALHKAFSGRADLGLAAVPAVIRMRFLDSALAPGGISDVTAPIADWKRVRVRPAVVLVVENLETVVALPPIDGVVVVHGSGYGAGARLKQIEWLAAAPRLLYWGDIDSHGFAILNEIRTHLAPAESVLMDRATLLAHRDLWVPEPKPFRGELPLLTGEESAALETARAEGDVRLEQERLEWAAAVAVVREACSSFCAKRSHLSIPESGYQ